MNRIEAIRTSLCKSIVRTRLARALDPSTPVARQRKILDQSALLTPPARGTRTESFSLGQMNAMWVKPAIENNTRNVILYIHGGGFVTGSCKSHLPLVSRLAQSASCKSLQFEYRLAPEHPWPAAIDDTVFAYRWLLEQGYLPEDITIAGDSAGGFLSIQLMLYCRDNSLPMPGAGVLFSPLTNAVDFDGISYRSRRHLDPWLKPESVRELVQSSFLAGQTAPDSFASDRCNTSGLPPLLVQAGDHEILLSDSVDFASNARKHGVDVTLHVYPGMWHVFQAFSLLITPGKKALHEAGNFIRQQNNTFQESNF